ncbi:MAG: hypothetical protein PUF04_09550 [bacterium]|nr:hypothetical protein [bacterium]
MAKIRPWTPGKHHPIDMSRFDGSAIKRPLIADLMSEPLFAQMANETNDHLSDEWVVRCVAALDGKTVMSESAKETMRHKGNEQELLACLRIHAFYEAKGRFLRKQFPEYATLYSEIKKGEMEKALHDE